MLIDQLNFKNKASNHTRSVSELPKRFTFQSVTASGSGNDWDIPFHEVLELLFKTLRDEHPLREAADRVLKQIEDEIAAKRRHSHLLNQYPANFECPNCGFIKEDLDQADTGTSPGLGEA